MEKECECYEEEVQPYRKTDYKSIIYILNYFVQITTEDCIEYLIQCCPTMLCVYSVHHFTDLKVLGFSLHLSSPLYIVLGAFCSLLVCITCIGSVCYLRTQKQSRQHVR